MRRHWMGEAWHWWKTFLFCLPALAVFAVFFLLPAAFSLYYGFFQWNGLDPEMTYVGFRNFLELFTDAGFWSSLLITIKVVVASIFLQSGLALLLATICVGARKGMKFFRSALFVPQVLSLAAVGAAWVLIYDPYYGVLNRLIESLGFERVHISWLGTPQLALPSMIATTTWAYFGFHMVLYLAAIAAIPAEIYDAVKFETTSRLKVFFWVTLPLLRETLLVSWVFIFTGTFGFLVGLFWMMTRGGPSRSTELLGLYMYRQTFVGDRFGYASAVALVIILILVGVVWVPIRRMARQRIVY